MDSQLEEAVERITKEVVGAVNAHVSAVEGRLADQGRSNLEAVATALTAAERRLSDQAVINVEAVKSEAKLAAEGYAGTLESIERRLGRIEGAMGSKFSDCDAVLKNHNDRILTLEQPGR